MPSLKINPENITMSGFSAGGFKTAYIFNQNPYLLSGIGILSGSLGNLLDDKLDRLLYRNSQGWLAMRENFTKLGLLPNASAFKGKYAYL